MTDERRHFDAHVAEFKALGDKTGEFQALVSVFGNVDRGGDRVMPGAFAKTLGEWRREGRPDPDHLEPHVGEPRGPHR